MWPSQAFLNGVSSVTATMELAIGGELDQAMEHEVALLSEDCRPFSRTGACRPRWLPQFVDRLASMSDRIASCAVL